jgi:hypothetical protein
MESLCSTVKSKGRCPLWVISCRGAVKLGCLLYPRKLPRLMLASSRIDLEGFIQGVFAQVLVRAFNLFSGRLWIYRLSAFGFGVDVGGG